MSTTENINSDANQAESSDSNVSATRQRAAMEGDIHDSPRDEEKMKSETFIIDLPDVSDIPGQENIVVPDIREMHDDTISSDDEEGLGLFDDDESDEDIDFVMGNEADVSSSEITLLKRADEDMPAEDDPMLRRAQLDSIDDQGDTLNEGSLATDVSGADLDVAGADADDPMEMIGEEDEENNSYSLGSDANDNVTEGTP